MNRIPEHLRFDRSIKVADLVSQFDVLLLAGSPDKLLTHVSTPHTAVSGSFLSLYDEDSAAVLTVGEAFICLTTTNIAEIIRKTILKRLCWYVKNRGGLVRKS